MGPVATLRPQDIAVGHQVDLMATVTEAEIDAFAALTGDVSPLHMDAEFARSRGFRGRVAHGLLLAGYASRLFGVHLPGRDAILHSFNIKWVQPVCAGDTVRLVATVSQISAEMGVMVAEVTATDAATGAVVARGKAQVGFTGADA
jgi:3-hydroxybutyryl-CoA dehydratase